MPVKLINLDGLVKVPKYRFPLFRPVCVRRTGRRKPESSLFKQLQTIWTPVFTGVTTFYEYAKLDKYVLFIFDNWENLFSNSKFRVPN